MTNVIMNSTESTDLQSPVLGAVLRAVAPMVCWLVRSGVGYTEFATALKPVFLAEARREAVRTGGKTTDSALSLLSGLHRKDVRQAAVTDCAPANWVPRASLPSQVVARWVASGWSDVLCFCGEQSFETLVKSISTDLHPRTVQHELVRLGVVRASDGVVELVRRAFTLDASKNESQQLLADSVADHLAAGVHNLTDTGPRKYLEQNVFADGLHASSAKSLEQLANQLWSDVMTRMVNAAIPLCENDEPMGGDQRLRLGMFCYAQPTQSIEPAQSQSQPQEPTT